MPETDEKRVVAMLERSRIDGDRDREDQARRELRRLGVRVEWEPRS